MTEVTGMATDIFSKGYPATHPNVIGSVVTFLDPGSGAESRMRAAILRAKQTLEPLLPKGLKLYWEFWKREDPDSTILKYSPKVDAEFLHVFDQGGLRWCMIASNLLGNLGPWVVAADLEPLRPGWPIGLSFSYDPKCGTSDGLVDFEWQERTVSLLKDLALGLDATYAHLTLEPNAASGLDDTPYEEWIRTPIDHYRELRRYARGYFWGNILSGEHIEQLGGVERIKTEAPCVMVKSIGTPERPLLYLQLTEDINDFSDEKLKELREFLKPILPTGPGLKALDRRFRLIYDDFGFTGEKPQSWTLSGGEGPSDTRIGRSNVEVGPARGSGNHWNGRRDSRGSGADFSAMPVVTGMTTNIFSKGYPAIHPKVNGIVVSFTDPGAGESSRMRAAILRTKEALEPLVPPGLKLYWEYISEGGFDSKRLSYSPKVDAKFLQILDRGGLQWCMIASNLLGILGPWVLVADVSPLRPGWPTTLSFSYDPRCVTPEGIVNLEWQERTASLLKDLAVGLNATYAHLTLVRDSTSGSSDTPYESWVGTTIDRFHQPRRHALWANVLSAEHIEQLGGVERIRTEAPPCVVVESIGKPEHPLLYLQLTGDINDFSEDKLKDFGEFLKPVLPTVRG